VSKFPEPPVEDKGSETPVFSVIDRFISVLEALTPGRAALLVFIAGMLSFLVLHFLARPLAGISIPLGGDPYDGYLQLAQNLVRGHGYVFEAGGPKVFHRPPLYPLLLVPAGLLPETAARFYVAALNSLLLALAGTIVRLFGREIFNDRIGAVGWFIFCFDPFILWAVKMAMAPICQTTAYLLMLWLSWRFYLKIRIGEAISKMFVARYTAGLLAGVMLHGIMLATSILLIAVLAFCSWRRRRWQALRTAFATLLLLLICISPWTWRNYKVTGMFIPVAGNSGLAYFAGNSHWGIGAPACRPDEERRQATLRHAGFLVKEQTELLHFYGFREPDKERLASARFKEHLLHHPAEFAKKFGLNAVEYYFPVVYYLFPPLGTYASQVPIRMALRTEANIDTVPLSAYHFLLLSLSTAGFLYLVGRREMRFQASCGALAWAIFAVPYFPFLTYVGHALYTFGSIPSLALLAGTWVVKPKELSFRWTRATRG
jgi:hypothetical protein